MVYLSFEAKRPTSKIFDLFGRLQFYKRFCVGVLVKIITFEIASLQNLDPYSRVFYLLISEINTLHNQTYF